MQHKKRQARAQLAKVEARVLSITAGVNRAIEAGTLNPIDRDLYLEAADLCLRELAKATERLAGDKKDTFELDRLKTYAWALVEGLSGIDFKRVVSKTEKPVKLPVL